MGHEQVRGNGEALGFSLERSPKELPAGEGGPR